MKHSTGPMVIVIAATCAASACIEPQAVAPQAAAARFANNTAGPFGRQLVAAYARARSAVKVRLLEANGTQNLAALMSGEADLTIAGADQAYTTYRGSLQGQATRRRGLRAIAALQPITQHLVVGADTAIHSVADLAGYRIATFGLLQETILDTLGIGSQVRRLPATSPTDAASLVGNHQADAAFVAGYYPIESVLAAIRAGARLAPIEGPGLAQLPSRYRFIRHVTIPANTYPGQPGPIHTMGVDTVLVCRSDLGEELVHELTKTLFDVLPALLNDFHGLRALDVEQAPATPIPLHEGAARFYRELELRR